MNFKKQNRNKIYTFKTHVVLLLINKLVIKLQICVIHQRQRTINNQNYHNPSNRKINIIKSIISIH